MTVHWTEAALDDLEGIESFISAHSEQYARAMVQKIFNRSRALANLPLLGPKVPEYGDENLRELVEHPYRIVYRIQDQQVDVVAVVHGARRMPADL